MSVNPNDRTGPIQTGSKAKAVVLSRNDPEKQNRYLIQIQGADGMQGAPQWVPIRNIGGALRGMGQTIRYNEGDVVSLELLGNSGQLYEIVGAHKNEKKDPSAADKHPEEKSEQFVKSADALGPTHPRIGAPVNWGKANGAFYPSGGANGAFYPSTPIPNGDIKTPYEPYKSENPVDPVVNEAPTPSHYGRNKPRIKPDEPGLGTKPYAKSDPAKVDKAMDEFGVPETIPNANKMIDQLRNTIKGGQNIPMQDALGGLGNILGALSGIASMFQQSQNTQQQKQDKKALMEAQLRMLYKTETGKEPLDIFGQETQEYQAWRTKYLKDHGLEDEYYGTDTE